jgi:hypothetical protein
MHGVVEKGGGSGKIKIPASSRRRAQYSAKQAASRQEKQRQ